MTTWEIERACRYHEHDKYWPRDESCNTIYRIYDAETDRTVVQTETGYRDLDEDDAKLIVAAPKLLELLQQAAPTIRRLGKYLQNERKLGEEIKKLLDTL